MRAIMLSLILCGGCLPDESPVGASSKEWSCPMQRVQNVRLPDVYKSPGEPPADVAADPQRLALWQRNHPRGKAEHAYVTSGCGKVGYVYCEYGANYQASDGSPQNGWYCTVQDVADAGAMELYAAELDTTGNNAAASALRDQIRQFFPAH